MKGFWPYGWLFCVFACAPREALEKGGRTPAPRAPKAAEAPTSAGLRLRPAACEVLDAARLGVLVVIDNPHPSAIGLSLPPVALPPFPEWSPGDRELDEAFAEATRDPPPGPELITVGETRCSPEPETRLTLGQGDRLVRGWVLERSPARLMTLDIAASFTEFSPDTPWERRRELACFRLRTEVRGAACRIVEARESPCHAPGAVYLDLGQSVDVSPSLPNQK